MEQRDKAAQEPEAEQQTHQTEGKKLPNSPFEASNADISYPEQVKLLLEFFRIKEPSLRARQKEVARIVFPFLIVNSILFYTIFAAKGAALAEIGSNITIYGTNAVIGRPFFYHVYVYIHFI